MNPVEAASVVRFERWRDDRMPAWERTEWIAQRRYIAAGLVLAQEVDRLSAPHCSLCDDCDDVEDDGTVHHCGWCPYQLALDTVERQHVVIAERNAEVERLEGENDGLRAELDRVNAELHEQYEAVAQMVETFAEAQVALQQAMGTP